MTAGRWVRIGAVAAVLAWTHAMGSVGPAMACSGTRLSTDEEYSSVTDIVFTGTAVRLDNPTNGIYSSTIEPLFWTFAVDSVVKGDLADRVTVATAMSGASCGFTFELGRRYRVYATDDDWYGHIATSLGSGNTQLPSLADPPPVEGEFHTLEYHLSQLGLWAAPGVLAVVLIGLGWWVVRRARR